jgi:SAM-dependent methyltransferase
VLDSRRIRRLVPDAPTGIGWHGEDAFLGALLPDVHGRARVLEIGCGAGRIARQVAFRAEELTCSDVSRIMLDEARENLAAERNVIFHRADGFHLAGFPDASFDLVLCARRIRHLRPESGARVARRGAPDAPAGRWSCPSYTIDRPHWAASQLEIVRRAARSGRFSAGHPRAYTAAQVDAMCEAVSLRVVDRRYGEGKAGDRGHYVVVAEPVSRPPIPAAAAVGASSSPTSDLLRPSGDRDGAR